jgi:hypothetical protein
MTTATNMPAALDGPDLKSITDHLTRFDVETLRAQCNWNERYNYTEAWENATLAECVDYWASNIHGWLEPHETPLGFIEDMTAAYTAAIKGAQQ